MELLENREKLATKIDNFKLIMVLANLDETTNLLRFSEDWNNIYAISSDFSQPQTPLLDILKNAYQKLV